VSKTNSACVWENQVVLITGVCGTVGKETLKQVLSRKPSRVVGIDINESELFFLQEEYRNDERVKLFLGDVRDRDTLHRKMNGVDIVLHTAAYKHVILCEESPRDAILTNIQGTQNVIDTAIENNVARVIFTSSDKAVNPTNVMGTSKLMGERLMTAANAHKGDNSKTIFASTRFGNVLGSNGSVLPLFKKQIASKGPVTLTDPAMTRFVMTLEESVHLVMDSVFLAKGGEVFVTKMPVIKISDLLQVLIDELAPRHGYSPDHIEVKVTGTKPGEKLYEELMNDEEIRRTVEIDQFFVIIPAFKQVYQEIDYRYQGTTRNGIERPYKSSVESPLSRDEIRQYLITNNLLD